jgi:hypothetical protein
VERRQHDAEPDGDDSGRSTGKYTAAEVEALGRQGKVFKNPDGHYSYPVGDRENLLRAIHAIGRSGLADKTPLRKFIIGRAAALGVSRMIPASWSSDGTLESGRTRPSTVLDLKLRVSRAEFVALEAEVTQLARQHRGGTARDRQEFVRRASRAAQEARARGDWEMAATWHRIQEQEIQAALVGL